jgi:hypothetical protein
MSGFAYFRNGSWHKVQGAVAPPVTPIKNGIYTSLVGHTINTGASAYQFPWGL